MGRARVSTGHGTPKALAYLRPDRLTPDEDASGNLTGWLIDKYGWGMWYPVMVVFGVLGGIAMLMVMRKQKRLAQVKPA